MRIAFSTEKDSSLLWINKRKEDIANLTNIISSEKKISAPSDAPSSWAQAMGFKQGLKEYDSILENIEFAAAWNSTTDSALNGVTDLLSQARQAAISANGPSGADLRTALATQLDGIIQNMVSAANTQHGDQYVFAGTDYNSAPFSIDDATGVVTYSGDNGQVKVRTNRGTTDSFTVNLTGTEAFTFTSGGSTLNIINEVWQLKTAIQNGDTNTITDKLGILEQASNAIAKQSATVGAHLSSLDQRKSAINLLKTNTTSNLSDIEDADLADAITKLTQASTAYEAALKVTGLVENLNLAYYL